MKMLIRIDMSVFYKALRKNLNKMISFGRGRTFVPYAQTVSISLMHRLVNIGKDAKTIKNDLLKNKEKSPAWSFGNLMFQMVIGNCYWIEPYPFSVAFFANNLPNSETILTMLSILVFRKMLKSDPQVSAIWKRFKLINSANVNSVYINSRHWGKFCSSVQLKALP